MIISKIKRRAALIRCGALIASLVLCAPAVFRSAAADVPEGIYKWYCVRNKEHKQPPAGDGMEFVEQFGGYYADKRRGDSSSDKVIYLTYDAGYENGNIAKTLDILKEHDVRAAFFVLENLVTRDTALVKRMAEEGHIVANHTPRHHDMSKVLNKEEFGGSLRKLEEIYKAATGFDLSKYYRPPSGKFSGLNMKHAHELGYKTIFWSFAYEDWDNSRQPAPDAAIKKILANTHNGAVILLHPTSKTNAEILGRLIAEWKSQGYRFGTLDELTAS